MSPPTARLASLPAKLVGVVLAGSLLCAQAQLVVPVDQEPQHKVVLKNDYVRILDATLPPGYVTLNHTHAVDNVSVTVANGRDGEAGLRGLGRVGFSKGGYSHAVTNSGTAIMRYIVIEPFKSDRPNAEVAALPHHMLETENERVRIYRVKLAAGESLESHTHATGRVEVMVAGPTGPTGPVGATGAGAWAWISGGENRPFKAPAGGPALEFVEVEPK
jgi:quercetin dioxygenase-like cupin family protein